MMGPGNQKSTSNTFAGRAHSVPAAFTLVELLVVIGIIAVLVGILLPALGRARESANAIKCMSNLRTMGQAMAIYVGEYKGSLPIGQVVTGDKIAPDGAPYPGPPISWTVLLAQVLSKHAGEGYADKNSLSGSGGIGAYGVFVCPTAPQSQVNSIFTDYSCHPRLMPNMVDKDPYTSFTPPFQGIYIRPSKLAHIKRATEIAVIFDAAVSTELGPGTYTAHVTANGLDRNGYTSRVPYMTDNYALVTTGLNAGTPISTKGDSGIFKVPADYNQDSIGNTGNIRFRHNKDKQCNTLMLDGHVTTFHYNPADHSTDLLEGNINVNR